MNSRSVCGCGWATGNVHVLGLTDSDRPARIGRAVVWIPGQRVAVAMVRHSPQRWWVALVTIAGAMLAAADASACDLGCKAPGPVGTDRPAEGAWYQRSHPLRAHKHPVTCPKFCRLNTADDDGTSRDPSDDEVSDNFALDDWDDLPDAAWLQNTGRSSITLHARPAPIWIETPSATALSRHPLRC